MRTKLGDIDPARVAHLKGFTTGLVTGVAFAKLFDCRMDGGTYDYDDGRLDTEGRLTTDGRWTTNGRRADGWTSANGRRRR